MRLRRLFALLVVLAVMAAFAVAPVFAQQTDPNVNIVYPPSIYVVNGSVNVVGTANAPGMVSYFLEYRPMIDARTPMDASVPWQPATLPSRTQVIGGTLGTWNTTLTVDGVYELRLTVFTSNNQPVYAVVRPVRVLNNPPLFAVTPTLPSQPSQPPVIIVTATPQQGLFVTATPEPSQNPEARAVIDANVRSGDGTVYPPIGALLNGETAPVIGISARGSGWWLIVLPNGRQGWVAPSTVLVTGNTGNLPFVSPPATPTPTFTPTPLPTATPQFPDAAISSVRFDRQPRQGEAFNVIVTVLNQSSRALPRFSVACNFTPMNAFFNVFVDGGLQPFGQIDVPIPVTLNTGGGGNVTANCAVDVNNLIQEISESNNFFNITTTLAEP